MMAEILQSGSGSRRGDSNPRPAVYELPASCVQPVACSKIAPRIPDCCPVTSLKWSHAGAWVSVRSSVRGERGRVLVCAWLCMWPNASDARSRGCTAEQRQRCAGVVLKWSTSSAGRSDAAYDTGPARHPSRHPLRDGNPRHDYATYAVSTSWGALDQSGGRRWTYEQGHFLPIRTPGAAFCLRARQEDTPQW